MYCPVQPAKPAFPPLPSYLLLQMPSLSWCRLADDLAAVVVAGASSATVVVAQLPPAAPPPTSQRIPARSAWPPHLLGNPMSFPLHRCAARAALGAGRGADAGRVFCSCALFPHASPYVAPVAIKATRGPAGGVSKHMRNSTGAGAQRHGSPAQRMGPKRTGGGASLWVALAAPASCPLLVRISSAYLSLYGSGARSHCRGGNGSIPC